MIGLLLIGLTNSVGIHFIGLQQKNVAMMISMFAIFNGIGRPIFGWLTDKLSVKKAMLISYSLIICVVFTAYGIGAVVGVAGSGLLLDKFQNYYYIFCFIIGLCVLGILWTLKMMND